MFSWPELWLARHIRWVCTHGKSLKRAGIRRCNFSLEIMEEFQKDEGEGVSEDSIYEVLKKVIKLLFCRNKYDYRRKTQAQNIYRSYLERDYES